MSRVETKVWAAVVGAGGGTVVGNAVLWILGVTGWGAPSDAAHAKVALDSVPPYIGSLITLALATIGTFAAGWYAPSSNHAGNAVGGAMDDSDAGHADVIAEGGDNDDDTGDIGDDDAPAATGASGDDAGADGDDDAELDDDDEREVDSQDTGVVPAAASTHVAVHLAEGP
jgi:hypothetical protein